MKIPSLLASLLVAGTAVMPWVAQAQGAAWPNKPIRFIVPFPAGGPTDTFSRAVTPRLGEMLGQTIIIENRGGAGGVIGTDAVAKAAPDGYTMGLGAGGSLIALPHLTKVPYSVEKDLIFVTRLVSVPTAISVNAKSGINSLQEYITRAKAQPGKLTYASAGSGTTVHLVGELFARAAGINILHVPYKGAAPALADLLGGQVVSMSSDISPVLPHSKAGTVRVLAISSAERTSLLPDVPTMSELGMRTVQHDTEYGVIMPAGTPPAIVQRVQQSLNTILTTPAIRDQFASMGAIASPSTSAVYRERVLGYYKMWGEFIKENKIKLD